MKNKIISLLTIMSVVSSLLAGCVETNVVNNGIADDTSVEESDDNRAEPIMEEAVTEEIQSDDFPFADSLTFTDEIFDYYATEGWQGAYKKTIAEFADSYDLGEDIPISYALYDIDKDGVPELLINTYNGGFASDTFFYYFDGEEVQYAGKRYAAHMTYYTYPDNNGLIESENQMMITSISKIAFDDGKIADTSEPSETLYYDSLIEDDKESLDIIRVSAIVEGSEEIVMYPQSYMVGLLEYDKTIKTCSDKPLSDSELETIMQAILDEDEEFIAVRSRDCMVEKMSISEVCNPEFLRGYGEEDACIMDTYYIDLNGDSQKECLVCLGRSNGTLDEFVLFSYQNGQMFGYIENDMVFDRKNVAVEDSIVYTSGTYETEEYKFGFYLDQYYMAGINTDRVAWSDETEAALESMRADIKTQNGVLGAAYIGYDNDHPVDYFFEVDEEDIDKYEYPDFVREFRKCEFIKEPGKEVFLIVPASKEYRISVYEQIYGESASNEMPERGRILYKGKIGEPIIVRGNENDMVSNLEISVNVSGKEIVYHPQLSSETGEIILEDGIVDLGMLK